MPSAKTHTLDIRLPEGVVFSLALAGPATRFLAWLLDLLFVYVVFTALNLALRLFSTLAPDATVGVTVLLGFAVPILYGILFEGLWRGQTPGKRMLRLRVMDAGGLRLDLKQVVIRNLLRAVDILPYFYLVGGAAMWFSARAQRLGDFAADTVVVRAEKPTIPDLAQIASGKYNTLRDHPVLAARLRQRVPPVEAGWRSRRCCGGARWSPPRGCRYSRGWPSVLGWRVRCPPPCARTSPTSSSSATSWTCSFTRAGSQPWFPTLTIPLPKVDGDLRAPWVPLAAKLPRLSAPQTGFGGGGAGSAGDGFAGLSS